MNILNLKNIYEIFNDYGEDKAVMLIITHKDGYRELIPITTKELIKEFEAGKIQDNEETRLAYATYILTK